MGEMADRINRFSERVSLPNDAARLKEMIIYISGKCQDDIYFGATKLNKILFKSDFRSFKRRGQPITGTAYFRLRAGPAPRAMVPIMRELHAEDAIATQRRWVWGREQRRPIALRPANLRIFDGEDIAIVDEVIAELWNLSATEASRESHGIQWVTRDNQDPIPYETALLSDEPPTADDIVRADEIARELGRLIPR